ncbi:TrkH family potassium uptake protein [Mesotoga prima]|uniref:TrkH family potassium uptake protein n=1 Tax=Mesotoga prima TaxID=1184387 RepID=UPI002FE14B40
MILLVPLALLPFFPEETVLAWSFLIPSSIALVSGLLLKLAKRRDEKVVLTLHEGGIIIVISWLAITFLSALPFIVSRQLNFSNSIFESVSGWTTTGLSMVDVESTPYIFLFWRSLMQFVGGAGIAVVMLSAIIGPLGPGLYNAEGRSDLLLPNVKKSTRLIVSIYSGYTVAGTLLYMLAGMNWFDAINHAMAALSTGGFSTKANSIGQFNSLAIEITTIILMTLGTVNFAAHYLLLKGRLKEFFRISELRFGTLLLALAIPIVSFLSLSGIYGSVPKAIRIGFFEFTSALSTTGFSTASYAGWGSLPILLMIMMMIIGGGSGSTAGGAKQYRIMLLFKSIIWNIQRYGKPGNYTSRYYVFRPEGKIYLTKNHFIETVNFITLYIFTYMIGVFIIAANGYSIRDAMFEFASSLGTVGLSVGVTSPKAPLTVTWTQIIGMLLGRLEFFVIFYSIARIARDSKYVLGKR